MIEKIGVEFVGTFLFLSVILMSGGDAFAIGVALAAVILWGGSISGGNFNPAVSIMQYYSGQLSSMEVSFYIFAQIFAGLAAFLFYRRYVLSKKN